MTETFGVTLTAWLGWSMVATFIALTVFMLVVVWEIIKGH